jgi:hypothetical protein
MRGYTRSNNSYENGTQLSFISVLILQCKQRRQKENALMRHYKGPQRYILSLRTNFNTRGSRIKHIYILIWYEVFNCSWVATRWQWFNTHIHTNNTGNVTQQTSHRTTQKMHRATKRLGRVWAVPRLCGHHPGICLTTEKKSRKNLSQGSHT